MEYWHHYLGEWVRNDIGTSAAREDPLITRWYSLDDIPEFERRTFELMEHRGLTVTCSGAHVYQIRQDLQDQKDAGESYAESQREIDLESRSWYPQQPFYPPDY